MLQVELKGVPNIKKNRNGFVFLLALLGLSINKLIGLTLGGIVGVFVAYSITNFVPPSIEELIVWCIGGAMLGLLLGSIVDMSYLRRVKSESDPSTTDPKYSAPDHHSGDGD